LKPKRNARRRGVRPAQDQGYRGRLKSIRDKRSLFQALLGRLATALQNFRFPFDALGDFKLAATNSALVLADGYLVLVVLPLAPLRSEAFKIRQAALGARGQAVASQRLRAKWASAVCSGR